MHHIDISPLYRIANDCLLTLLAGLATFVGGWFTWLLHKYAPPFIGAQLESKAADDLNLALGNGVAVAMQKIEKAERLHSDFAVKSAIAAFAARYAIDHAPQAVAAFGLDLDGLELKALAYLPTPPSSSQGTTGLRIHTEPVAMQPLPNV